RRSWENRRFDFPQRRVVPGRHALEPDALDVAVGAVACLAHRVPERDEREDAPPGRLIPPGSGGRPGMERKDVALDRAEAVDGKAGLIRPRISARGQHDPDTRPRRPRWSGPAERTARGCLEQRNQVALQPWQNDLRLRIAQAG